MSLSSFSVSQPVLMKLLVLVVCVLGFSVLGDMPRENFPDTPLNEAIVVVLYPGTPAEDMERLVAMPVEDELQDLDKVDHITTISYDDKTVIDIKYEPELDDLDQAVVELRAELEKVELPEDAQKPLVFKVTTDEVMPVVHLLLGGPFSPGELKEITESMKELLLDIEGVSNVEIMGTRDREIRVQLREDLLVKYGLTFNEISQAIAAHNLSLPGGPLHEGRKEHLLRAMSDYQTVEQIRNTVVRAWPDGQKITLKDVATVRDTYHKKRIDSRLEGNPTVVLSVYKKKSANIIDVVDQVIAVSRAFTAKVPGLSFSAQDDQSIDVREFIDVLFTNGVFGMVLVTVMLWALMGWRNAGFVLVGIPFSYGLTLLFMHSFGFTINTLSLFCFVLVLGIIVDDAIIILENVYRHMEHGFDRVTAAIKGTDEVFWPVVSAIVTNVAAFLPLLLMEGQTGKFLWTMPVIVTFALMASLVEALVALPSHIAEFGNPGRVRRRSEQWSVFKTILRHYRRLLRWTVLHRYLTFLIVVGFSLLALTLCVFLIATGYIPVRMFGKLETSTINLHLRMPIGTRLEATRQVVQQIEESVGHGEHNEIKSIFSFSGLVIENYRWLTRSDVASITFDLGSREKRRRSSEEVKNYIRERVSRINGIASYEFIEPIDGPPMGKPVEVRVMGDDLDRLYALATLVKNELQTIGGAVDIQMTRQKGKGEIRVIPRVAVAAKYGFTPASIALWVKTAFEGTTAARVRFGSSDEIKVILCLPEAQWDSVDALKKLRLVSPSGAVVYLPQVADIVMNRGIAEIHRRNRKRFVTVTANIDEKVTSSDAVNRELRKRFASFATDYPGYTLGFGGEAEEQAKSFNSLYRLFALTLFVIYVILAAQFQSYSHPLVVMFAVPFSFIGVVVGLMIQHLAFSLVALISIVALAGIVVNDSLVLVDFINKARREGVSLEQALVQSGERRMRPILLTSITTIGGLLPMSIGLGGTNPTWQPMAICMCWGLGFSTILTLFFIPALYGMLTDVQNLSRRVWSRLKKP